MQYQRPPTSMLTNQFRGIRNGFLAGLVVGMLIGWFFHGFVGLVVRFGFVLLLLIPLAVVVWFFFLRNRAGVSEQQNQDGMQVFTWRSGEGARQYTADPRQSPPDRGRPDTPASRNDDDVIDSEFRELKRRAEQDG